nr:hypothetical protein [Nanoarchaeota archaeon]
MKKAIIGLMAVMLLTIGMVSADLEVGVDATGGDTVVDVDFSGIGMDVWVGALGDNAGIEFSGSSGWLGGISGDVHIEDIGDGLDTTVSAAGLGLTRIEFDFLGWQPSDDQTVWAYADGTIATMDVFYDTGNSGDLWSDVSAGTLFRDYHAGYGMESGDGLTDVSLEGRGYGELTGDIYGNDGVYLEGDVFAIGSGEFNHYAAGDDYVDLNGWSFNGGFGNTYINFDSGLSGSFYSEAN